MSSTLSADTSRFTFSAGDRTLLVAGFRAAEQISQLFKLRLSLASEEECRPAGMIGRPGSLTVESEDEDRYWHGIIHECHAVGTAGRFNLYEAVMRPEAAILNHRRNCRIFQHKNVPLIVSEVLKQAGVTTDLFTFRLKGRYVPRDYCVQYRETDLRFVRRLLAEEGIFFFFEHGPDGHRMVFGDSPVNYQPIAGEDTVAFNPGSGTVAESEAVVRFSRGRRILSGKYVQRDFNFEKPALDLTALDQQQDHCALELYDYPGTYALPEQGTRLARVRLEAAAMYKDRSSGESVIARFTPGFTFTLDHAGVDGFDDGPYLLTGLTHTGEQPQVLAERSDAAKSTVYRNKFTAIPADVPFRPNGNALKKPMVRGVQTAIVTGPEGEEIYTDRHGRIKIQFHWDRLGGRDEKSSCWIRVSQGWAGAGWGAMFIPRIGQEVIVDFLEGDPDRPLVTGRVYHGENTPPYDLPDQKTVSTLKSLSTPGGEGFNEIRFEDRKGEEQIFMHAEKDMDLRVNNDRRIFIGNDAHQRIKKDLLRHVDGRRHLTIHADDSTRVDGTRSLTVAKDRQEKVGGNYGLESAGQVHVSAGSSLVLEAGAGLTLKAGAGFINIDSKGVSLSGPKINLNSGGAPGSGQGVFPQMPAMPIEAATALPGRVDRVDARDPSRAAAVTTQPRAKATAVPAVVPPGHEATAPSPEPGNLYARIYRKNSMFDQPIYMSAGYAAWGLQQLERDVKRPIRYSSIVHRDTPVGNYILEFRAFEIEHMPLKA